LPAQIDDMTLRRLNSRANPQGLTVLVGPIGVQLVETSNHWNVIAGGRWGTSIAHVDTVLNNQQSVANIGSVPTMATADASKLRG
jgi:hypothetical protein